MYITESWNYGDIILNSATPVIAACTPRAGGRCGQPEGIVRARFRESLSDPRPIEPNQVYEYRLDLGPTAIRIPLRE